MFGPRPRLAAFWIGLLKPASREQYLVALRIFSDWAHVMFPDFWLMSEEDQDFALSEYALQQKEEESVGVQLVATTIAAISRVYGRRRRYAAASLTVEGWRAGTEIRQAPPMPSVVCYAMVTVLAAADRLQVALAVLLCFTGVMRISEVLSLRVGDVLVPAEHLMVLFILILLRAGKRDVPDATRIVIGRPDVVHWAITYKALTCEGRGAGEPFCMVSYTTFRKWLRRASAALGFSEGYFTSHSMRRGGATEMARAGIPLLDVMQYGRWASFSSFRLYIAKGEVLLTRWKQSLDDADWQKLFVLARLILAVLARPKT